MRLEVDEYIGISKYSKRPKRESEKTIKINGKARANFSAHKGNFKNEMSHTLFTNAQNISGIENKGRSSKFIDYIIDKNKALAVFGDKDRAKEHFKKIENDILPKRTNSVIQRRLVVQLPREFLNNADLNLNDISKMLDEKYFSRSGAFVVALHDGGTDFKNPHLHIVFSGRDANLKNIREYHDKNFLNSVKKDIAQFITQEIGVKCEVSNERKPQNRHYPRWVTEAYKRAIKDTTGETLKKYIEKYPIFENYVNDINYRDTMKDLKNEEKEFNREYTAFAKKNKKVFDKIHGPEEAKIKEKVKEIKKGVMDMDLEPLKNIDVVELAERMGFERDKYDRKAYKRGDLKVSIDERTGRFNSFIDQNVHGRGTIDFIIKTENKDFRGAIEFLSNEYSTTTATKPKPNFSFQRENIQQAQAKQEEPEKIEPEKKILELPTKAENTEKLKKYLFGKRKINEKLVDRLISGNMIYQDVKGNVVFLSRDLTGKEITGAELKNESFKGLAKGSNRNNGSFQILTTGEGDKKLVITESAIDAISYFGLKKPLNTAIVSTSGVIPYMTKFVDDYISKNNVKTVKIAYDNDVAGITNAEALKADIEKKYPDIQIEIVKSKAKDWNEDLQQLQEIEKTHLAQELQKQQKKVNSPSPFISQNSNSNSKLKR